MTPLNPYSTPAYTRTTFKDISSMLQDIGTSGVLITRYHNSPRMLPLSQEIKYHYIYHTLSYDGVTDNYHLRGK